MIHTIRKVKFLSKNSILTKNQYFHEFFTQVFFFDNFSHEIKAVNSKKVQNPNIFTSFSLNFFLSTFLVKTKLSTAKKYKTTTFSRVFHQKKSTIFSGKQSCQQLKSANPQHFHPNFFLTIFLVKSKLSTAKKSTTTTISRVFHPKKSMTLLPCCHPLPNEDLARISVDFSTSDSPQPPVTMINSSPCTVIS